MGGSATNQWILRLTYDGSTCYPPKGDRYISPIMFALDCPSCFRFKTYPAFPKMIEILYIGSFIIWDLIYQ